MRKRFVLARAIAAKTLRTRSAAFASVMSPKLKQKYKKNQKSKKFLNSAHFNRLL
jgi:mannose/fructose/N-acetylgalactosamine-specific phosphotransferase system component IID